MPILNKRHEYVIPLTMSCNWKCPYCAINNKYDKKILISNETTLLKLNSLPNGCICTLTGGEPGLLDYIRLKNYFNILIQKNITIYIETNGLFIEKYPLLVNDVYEILYHCSENLTDSLKYYDYNNIRYVLVITDENICHLNKYFDANFNGIKFDLIPATYPYSDDINGPTLSEKNKIYVLTHYYKFMTNDSITRFCKDKNFNSITWLFDS